MSIVGLDNLVSLEPIQHKYFHKVTSEEYMSVSKFMSLFKKPFDKSIAYNCAGKGEYEGMTAEEVLLYWEVYGQERAKEGTELHEANERFSNTTEILEKHEKWRPAILNISSKYKCYYRVYNEVVLHDDENLIAGTSDRVLVTSSHKEAPLDISDYKTNKTGVHQVDLDKKGQRINKQMLHCLSHLTDSKHNFYSLQLSLYAYMLQKQTGRKIGKLFIHYINPENPLINYSIPVNYLYYEIIEMLAWRKSNAIKIEPAPTPEKKSAFNTFSNNNFLNDVSSVQVETEDDSI